ncbi:CAMK protein kinase [Aphanomyces invadans]|uniref:CAMK protein kinase n=1 Tax=Aphanomyces invadans TaxID=157072 RepID=A0A024ULG9_9STRA|nr:CAMK protein kinase [Aphanomyces invadans]ETW07296.1 CAMK protein kinase [Aphanomyces invadans]|eukprot:XP_008863389.1 CAMK protein kinase [Aphanomyces invadans]
MGLCCSGHGHVVSESAFVFEGNAYIGKGSHSKVFRAKYKTTGDIVAIKMIVKDAARQEWHNEVAVMKMLDVHPNVIELKGTYETDEFVCVVMEYAAGGELFQLLIRDGAYSEEIARKFIRDTLLALEFLHDQGIAHGDLKPENLLVTSKHAQKARVKLADFSMAAIMTVKHLVDKDGLTWAYCAPEVLGDEHTTVNPKGDMWSVGVLLFIVLSAMHPFDLTGRCSKEAIVSAILAFQIVHFDDSQGWGDVTADAKDLIRRLLCRDPTQRLSAKEALQHPWFAHESAPTLPLQCSLRGDLNVYMRSMQARFRTTVVVAMAARRFSSLHKKPDDLSTLISPQDVVVTHKSVIRQETMEPIHDRDTSNNATSPPSPDSAAPSPAEGVPAMPPS